jgi:hypothetical protein
MFTRFDIIAMTAIVVITVTFIVVACIFIVQLPTGWGVIASLVTVAIALGGSFTAAWKLGARSI